MFKVGKMSYGENFSDEEKQAIAELKNRIYHELTPKLKKDETLYYRFLKARDFDVNKAEAMLRKHLSDRKLYNIENIDKYTPPEFMQQLYPTTFLGYDKEGCLIRYFEFGSIEPRVLALLYDLKDIIRFVCWYFEKDMERLEEKSKELGKKITTHIPVFNFDNVTFSQLTFRKGLEMLRDGFKFYQDNYPERLKTAYIINAPSFFNVAFSFIKIVFPTDVLKKIKIFGKTGWKEELLKVIDTDVLPAFLGGTRTDPDGNPMCVTLINRAKPVPEEAYKNRKRKSINTGEAKSMKIPRSSSSEIKLEISEPYAQIEWEFQTKTSDIAFSLNYTGENQDDQVVELIPKHRVNTEFSPESGIYMCEKPGIYTIVFDNSYSWLYSKEVHYIIRLIKPIPS